MGQLLLFLFLGASLTSLVPGERPVQGAWWAPRSHFLPAWGWERVTCQPGLRDIVFLQLLQPLMNR